MKTVLIVTLVLLAYTSSCTARDLLVGQVHNTQLAHQETIEYNAIPFTKRVKEYFYNDPSQHIIRGIVARDGHGPASQASVIVTSGGVGSTYVNLRLKSERGSGLKYHIELYYSV